MHEVWVGHTAELGRGGVRAIRELLEEAFAEDFAETDMEHSLGGVHVCVREEGALVAHGAVVQRRLLHGGRALRTGYVEGVAVRADRRRRGYGGVVLAEVERVVRAAYDLGALGSTDAGVPFYTSRGWRVWRGPTYALTPEGVVRTPEDDGGVFVLPGDVPLDLDAPLTCDWRDGDVW
ncbi:GNAT family N-acetyltransferase [Streptomyces sp. TRM 70351]|uniref:GNAT family N-acetyltransferase n=1 Tax=Streptomyces sp. TRM 70351 TaxID=3116552 RepID=UPI002E7B8E76|nr:GNAT family N-acetyltransferase [Streptomyces sp. TRM 70351]MEE1929735.1 GNAT family N-acetyltransferase [Streptomyces sp. TRM 70351]